MYKILVVEDTLAIREEVYDILLMEGYSVFQAENGKIGFEMALKEHPDLIISDILMPILNGFEMFEKLQKVKKTKSIPLIFLSAKGDKKDIRTGMNLGAEDYLTKPINLNDLVNAVENKIKKKLIVDQKYLSAFIEAQELEKQSFGEELHDGVSQILSAQSMFVDVLNILLKDADGKVLKHLNTVKELNTQAINETRSISHGLMSKQLKEKGLIVAVEHICKNYNTSRDIKFSFSCIGLKEKEINKELKSNIFRIIQEVTTNTVRHSTAKKAQVILSKITKNQLKVVIKDNGIGIDFERMKQNKKGAGIENIKRRIKLLNGTIDLKTVPNKGTQYTFIVPLGNIQ